MTVHPKDKHPIYDEGIIRISLDDEECHQPFAQRGGAYLVLEQEDSSIRVDLDELEVILDAAKKLMEGVKDYDKKA